MAAGFTNNQIRNLLMYGAGGGEASDVDGETARRMVVTLAAAGLTPSVLLNMRAFQYPNEMQRQPSSTNQPSPAGLKFMRHSQFGGRSSPWLGVMTCETSMHGTPAGEVVTLTRHSSGAIASASSLAAKKPGRNIRHNGVARGSNTHDLHHCLNQNHDVKERVLEEDGAGMLGKEAAEK
jgi:hypothetical protein